MKIKSTIYPPCPKRKIVNGIAMCYAIGCCEIGDMPCECDGCTRECKKRNKDNQAKARKKVSREPSNPS